MYAIPHAAPRILATLPLAALTTLGLLLAMATMIQTDEVILVDDPYPRLPPVVMEPPKPIENRIKKPERVEEVAPTPPAPERKWEARESTTFAIAPIATPPIEGTAFGLADSLPFARVMAPPAYPYRAAQAGIEGYVDLRFDITASGATENIQVVHAEPEGVFEQSALAAVARWRFQPSMVDGKAEAFKGLSKRVRFTLHK